VVTTDMPLTPDRPIDFGLQDFCSQCRKCARECPCHAISFGDKIMFNGYEMWKPDVEKCARYRITNPKGSACGRCMKTCPYNMEGLLVNRLFLWAAMHLPFARGWIAQLDDKVGNGRRNRVKKWWWDLEIIDGVATRPKAGTNARDLDLDGEIAPEDQKLAVYPFDMVPPADATDPVPVDRKEGLRRMADAPRPR
jgi:ferredoxin